MKAVLVLNAGSSSLKFALFATEPTLAERPALAGQIEGIGATPELSAHDAHGMRYREPVISTGEQAEQHRDALTHLLRWLSAHNPDLEIIAAGHRIVHGGERYSAPVRLTEAVLRELDAFVPLAPLHQPHNLRAVRAVAA
ncbi:MAG TPA: acetate kinase, partial [Pseudothauera hydrothermalis]|nr:acetate kinase [Pseudothauera hydrothermalis]